MMHRQFTKGIIILGVMGLVALSAPAAASVNVQGTLNTFTLSSHGQTHTVTGIQVGSIPYLPVTSVLSALGGTAVVHGAMIQLVSGTPGAPPVVPVVTADGVTLRVTTAIFAPSVTLLYLTATNHSGSARDLDPEGNASLTQGGRVLALNQFSSLSVQWPQVLDNDQTAQAVYVFDTASLVGSGVLLTMPVQDNSFDTLTPLRITMPVKPTGHL